MGARVMILAGGTGGHIFPALAVADELRRRGHQVFWMGTRKGLEARIVPAAGIEPDWLKVAGVRGKGWLTLLRAPFMLVAACVQAAAILRRRKPQVVLGMGGFVAGPGGLMAWLLRIPLVVHEQNRVPGTTNRLLARFASQLLEAFPGSFPAAKKARCTGNPLRQAITDLRQPLNRQPAPLRLLVLGGSQGARILNEMVPAAVAAANCGIEVLHQSGSAMEAQTERAYQDRGVNAKVRAFLSDMEAAYGWADLVVCRAGAMTVSELAATGRPAILVPFPHAIDDHQTMNARYLSEAGAALLLPQTEFGTERLARELRTLAADRKRLEAMGTAARALARPEATATVADICLAEVKS